MCKKLMLLLVVFALVSVTAGVGQAAELITAVAHRNTDSDGPEDPQIADSLEEGSLCFVDRTHIYVEIPESLVGAEYVILANDNKNMSTYELDLTISQNATVYVFVDNRMGGAAGGLDVEPNIDGMPWLGDMGFVDTGLDIGIDESADGSINQYFSVFALDVKAGITTIFGNTEGHGGNMLGVAVMSRTPAESAYTPSPESEAVDVPRDLIVGWQPGEEVTAHDVYLGSSFEDVNGASRSNPMGVLLSEGQPDTTLDVGRLEFEQTYYWRVDEVLADGSIYHGEVWSFTVEPLAYPVEGVAVSSNAPSSETAGVVNIINGSGLNADDEHSVDSTDMWLSTAIEGEETWLQYEFDQVYKLHEMLVWNYNVEFEVVLGFGVKETTVEYSADGVEWTVLGDFEFAQATAMSGYAANTVVDFGGAAVQFVKITIHSNWGGRDSLGLSEIRFLYIPVFAREPEPAAAANVDVDLTLSWRSGREAASHDVYFGTDSAALELLGNVSESAFALDALDYDTTYYWKVAEVNEAEAISTWEGEVWSFSTQEYAVVDDFESYNDDDNLIYETWEDGWYNETGSTVGYFEAPFAETTIVHSGSQAMPLFYDNSGAATAEAELALSQDWTASGIASLSLYFHGDPENTGQLFVEISGERVDYDGDPADLTIAAWQPWNIDLSAVGNISNVNSLIVGVEGAGASGVVYIDDIRLYPRTPVLVEPVEPSSEGLVALYEFEGNADDSSGNGHHGTLNGGVTFVAGVEGSALDCDGIDGYVSTGKSASDLGIAGNAPRTVTVWVYTRGFGDGAIYDVGARTTAQDFSLRTLDSTEDRWRVQYWGGDSDFSFDTDNKWVHFTHVHDGTYTKIYANGMLIVDWEKTIETADDNPFQIGQYGWPGSYFDGLIDELHLYNRALSAAEALGAAGQTMPRHQPF